MKIHLFVAFSLIIIFNSPLALAKNYEGTLEIKDWQSQDGTVKLPIMKLRYKFDIFFGEPTEKFIFYYESQDKFTEVFNIKLSAQVVSDANLQDAYIKTSPLVEPPGKWGWDISGSPNWNQMFINKNGKYITAKQAKSYFKKGFSLANLEIKYIHAQSGVDDQKYNAFSSLLPLSYVRSKDHKGKLDGNIPTRDYWNTSNSFWKDRVSGFSNWLSK